jgi:hypothetical protein
VVVVDGGADGVSTNEGADGVVADTMVSADEGTDADDVSTTTVVPVDEGVDGVTATTMVVLDKDADGVSTERTSTVVGSVISLGSAAASRRRAAEMTCKMESFIVAVSERVSEWEEGEEKDDGGEVGASVLKYVLRCLRDAACEPSD